MKKIIFAFILILFLPAEKILAQYDKQEFRENFEQGNLMILEQFYDTALQTFLYLRQIDSNNANVNYKVGFLYLNTTEKHLALPYLLKAADNVSTNYKEFDATEKSAPGIVYYYLAIAQHYEYRFDEAIANFEKYKSLVNAKNIDIIKDINHRIDWCRNAKILIESPAPYIIELMDDSINSEYDDFAPIVSADEYFLFFTSRRPGMGGLSNKTLDEKHFEDIWVCFKKEDGTWSKAKNLGEDINSYENDAASSLSADGQKLYLVREIKKQKEIFYSENNGESWSTAAPLGSDEKTVTDINTSKYNETNACISPDGKTLYFVSDRPGGIGGKDIYKCSRLPNGLWSKSINLGPKVNTPYDEEFPFMHPDGITLFFSSQGHNSMGGFDVFFVTKTDSGWLPPVNMGFPVNTTYDNKSYVSTSDGKKGFISQYKPSGKGGLDIYSVTTPKAFIEPISVSVLYIKSKNTPEIPSGVTIRIISKDDGSIKDCQPSLSTGKVILTLKPGKEYAIEIEKDGNIIDKDEYKAPFDDFNETYKEYTYKTFYVDEETKQVTTNIIVKNDTTVKQNTNVSHNANNKISFENPDFSAFFTYAKSNIDTTSENYVQLLNAIKNKSASNKKLVIYLQSSASKVPVRLAYSNNQLLSKARANTAKKTILASLKSMNVPADSIVFKIEPIVSGPEYQNDFIENRALYEKYQFVKIVLSE